MATVVQFPAHDLERNWREFWRTFSYGIRSHWHGTPGLEEALERSERWVRGHWFELYAPVSLSHTAPELELPEDLPEEQQQALQRAAQIVGARTAAAFKRRLDTAAVWIAFQTIRAETGWRDMLPSG